MREIVRINLAIDQFASAMREKMMGQYFKGKRGWEGEDSSFFLGRLDNERDELNTAWENGESVYGECVDVALFAMMIANQERAE